MARVENNRTKPIQKNQGNFFYDDNEVEGNVTDSRLPHEFDTNGSYRSEAWEKIDHEEADQNYLSDRSPEYNGYYGDMNARDNIGADVYARTDHRGKGPKGWKRSDERIREDVCEALYNSYDVDASQIEVYVEEGIARLSGAVPTRRMKKIAENLTEKVGGIVDVQNEIQIRNTF